MASSTSIQLPNFAPKEHFHAEPVSEPVAHDVCNGEYSAMEEIIRTNDLVLISFIEALFNEAGIAHLVLDAHMSTMEGSLGIIARRILVDTERLAQARTCLRDAGLAAELREP